MCQPVHLRTTIKIVVVFMFAIGPLLFNVAIVSADDKTRDETNEDRVVVVTLGDSITKGVRKGVKTEQTFAGLLQQEMDNLKLNVRVQNVGIGGERTDQALKRLDSVLKLKPNIVAIMYGTNDSYVDKGRTVSRISAEEYRENLDQLVKKLADQDVQVVLMTEPRWAPAARNGVEETPNDRLSKYMEACRSIAEKQDLPLVDHFADWTRAEADGAKILDWTTDGCHPNSEGHRRMADLISPVLLQIVEKLEVSKQ